MQIDVQFNPIHMRRMQRQLASSGKAVGITTQWLCWDQMRLACLDAVKYSPPWAGKGKPGTGKAQQATGKKAVAYDLFGIASGETRRARRMGVFDKIPPDAVRTFQRDGATFNVTKDGRIYIKDETLYRPNASPSEMRAHHLKYRLKNGRTTTAGAKTKNIGRWKSTAKMRVSEASANRYLQSVQSRVGSLKASWIPALLYYGSRVGGKRTVPAWIAKQNSMEGTYVDRMSANGNGILVSSSVAHHTNAIRPSLEKWLKTNRQRQMNKYTERRMQQIADQFNANRTTVAPIRQNAPI